MFRVALSISSCEHKHISSSVKTFPEIKLWRREARLAPAEIKSSCCGRSPPDGPGNPGGDTSVTELSLPQCVPPAGKPRREVRVSEERLPPERGLLFTMDLSEPSLYGFSCSGERRLRSLTASSADLSITGDVYTHQTDNIEIYQSPAMYIHIRQTA